MERHIELADHVLPLYIAGLHIVQLLLHTGGELYIHDVGEALTHQVVDHLPQRCDAQVLALLDDVLAVQNGGHGGGIGGGAADAVLLHGTDQRGVGVPGGRLGEVLRRGKALQRHALALRQLRQGGFLLLLVVVTALLVHGGIARELQIAGGAAEAVVACADLHADAVVDGVGHLARQKTAPDQAVQSVLLAGEVALDLLRRQRRVGGADGLVGVLRPGLRLVGAGGRGVIALSVAGADHGLCLRLRLGGDTQRVGTHIGDETHRTLAGDVHALIELLGNGHGAAGGHIQLAGRLLL